MSKAEGAESGNSVEIFREIFEAVGEAYCLCEMLLDDDGKPVDYLFLEVNQRFEEMSGLSDPVGRTALELVPDLERHWIETYARVAIDGESIRLQQGSEAMGRWWDVVSMPLGGPRRFGVGFRDETARRRAELDLQASEARHREIAERERRISLRLQRALLPDALDDHPLLDIDAHYSASDAALDVGGDWFDTIAWPDGSVAIVVGDIVGHDLEAAATMGRLRGGTKALALAGPSSASAVLDALDRCARGPEGASFVTAVALVFEPDSTSFEYAVAGHPPPLVEREGSTQWLDDAHGGAIGTAMPPATFPTRHGKLALGESVILYTDGVVEERGDPIDVGLARLAEIAGNCGSAAEIASSMAQERGHADDVVILRITARHGAG